MDTSTLKESVKSMIVENLMLQITADTIADDQSLFGPGSLGLDSVDALQLVVGLDKHFGLQVPNPAVAKEILRSVNAMVAAIEQNGAVKASN